MSYRASSPGPLAAFVRETEDPFSCGTESLPGTRVSEESWKIAYGLSELLTATGGRTGIVDEYLSALARAPAEHMRLLAHRGARVVFSPTIPEALDSDWAAGRRRRGLTPQERLDSRTRYSRASGAAAIYDPGTDALIFPTTYAAPDFERVVIHELGHALTMPTASIHAGLLNGLPREIAEHINNPAYGDPRDPGSLRSRVNEALAEGYVYLVVGKADLLPAALTSDLLFILGTVTDDHARIRFDFDEETGRTASFVDPATLLCGSSVDDIGMFAPESRPGEQLEAFELAGDELGVRRRQRRAA